VCARTYACVCACVPNNGMCVCVHAHDGMCDVMFVCLCLSVCVFMWLSVCIFWRSLTRACMRACVFVCACMRVCACVRVFFSLCVVV